jgi:hypothetical protein
MRKRKMSSLGIAAIAIPAFVGLVEAHHSVVAQFDLNNPITLKGTLTKLEWVNPHAFIYVTAKGPGGETRDWKIEAGSPGRMEKRGLKKTDFQVGHDIIVSGFLAKDGSNTVAGWVVNFPEMEGKSGREASFTLGR